MNKKLNYANMRQQDQSRKQDIIDDVHHSEDSVKNDRIEWLKQLYAGWLEKRYYISKKYIEIYLINELSELDSESDWYDF